MYKSYNFAILGSSSKHSNHKFWKKHSHQFTSAISHPILSTTLHAVYVSSATCKWVTAVCTQTPAPISPSNAKSPWSPWSIADALEFLSCLQTVACPHDEGRHKNIILSCKDSKETITARLIHPYIPICKTSIIVWTEGIVEISEVTSGFIAES